MKRTPNLSFALAAAATVLTVFLVATVPVVAGDFSPASGLAAATPAKGRPTIGVEKVSDREACYLRQMDIGWGLFHYYNATGKKLERYNKTVGDMLTEGDYRLGFGEQLCDERNLITLFKGYPRCRLHGPAPANHVPDPQRVARYRKIACWRTQMSLFAAVRRYNTIHPDKTTQIFTLRDANLLLESGLLTRLPDDPGKGPGTFKNFELVTSGLGCKCPIHSVLRRRPDCHLCQARGEGVNCTVHGTCSRP